MKGLYFANFQTVQKYFSFKRLIHNFRQWLSNISAKNFQKKYWNAVIAFFCLRDSIIISISPSVTGVKNIERRIPLKR